MSSSSSSSSLLSVVCRHFSLDEIKDATNNFDKSNVLGHGGEGMVYLGHIEEKYPVAVKRLNPNSIVFENEIKTVSKIQHPNVVSLLGYCNEFNQQILVYEYMERGSLSDYVKKNSRICLSWKQRLNACLGAARGLQYLHTATDELPKGIIHRDMKPANILLERNWVAKVSDFGMFKLSHADQTNSTMNTALKGTCGYYAPEYLRSFRITRKIDVYAFGVVLFQVLCRKMPWDREDQSYYVREDEDLGLWAKENVDTEIHGEISNDCLEVFVDIIGRSLRSNPADRPTMDEVVLDLERALVKCHEPEDHEGMRNFEYVESIKDSCSPSPVDDVVTYEVGPSNKPPMFTTIPKSKMQVVRRNTCFGQPSDYINQLPIWIQEFVVETKNVIADGHCGFRAISAHMYDNEEHWYKVRTELAIELDIYRGLYEDVFEEPVELVESMLRCYADFAPKKHWFQTPEMGYLVASFYNVCFVVFSNTLSLTFLPLRNEAPDEPKLICIAFVNGDHYIQVFLRDDSPLPPIARTGYKQVMAKGWNTIYSERWAKYSESVRK